MKDGRHGGSSMRARLHQLNRMMFAGRISNSEPSAKPSDIRYALPASAPFRPRVTASGRRRLLTETRDAADTDPEKR